MDPARVCKSGEALLAQIDRTNVPGDGIAIWHLGQEGLAVKRGGVIYYFDPYLTSMDRLPRNYPPLLEPEQVNNADYVFISHHHIDHLDTETVRGIGIASPGAVFICPAPHTGKIAEAGIATERIIAAKAHELIKLPGNVTVTPIPCKHEEYIQDEAGNHFFLGYVLDMDGLVFYHAGDAIADRELAEALKPLKIEIACLPINGHDWIRLEKRLYGNMTAREAADLGAYIDAELVIPFHYDMFAYNTENPATYVDYAYRTYPARKCKLLVPGERMVHLSERL